MRELLLFVIILLLVCGVMALGQPQLYKIGEVVDFTLPSLRGNSVHSADFKGKIVFIDFFFPEEVPCPNAQRAFEKEKGLIATFKDKNVVFISIGLSKDVAQTGGYVSQKNKDTLVLVDADQKVYQKFYRKGVIFSTYTFPCYVIIDANSKLVWVSNRTKENDSGDSFYQDKISALLKTL